MQNCVFLCSLDHFLLKNVIVFFFFGIKFQNGAHLKKGLFLNYFSHFFSPGKFLQRISHIHIFCSPYWLFLPYQFCKNYEFIMHGFSLVWLLVYAVNSYSCHFEAINKKQNGEQNWSWNVVFWYLFTLMQKWSSFVNPGLRMTVGEYLVQYRKCKKHCFLAAAILLFIGKIIIT